MTRESGSWEGKIESLTHEGLGVGTVILKQAGKMLRRPIFVPYTVPGDIVVVDVTEQKRKYMFGEISAVLKESPEREVPRCKHFTDCGGCNLQQVSYAEQLKQKGKQTAFLLQRKGVILPHEITVTPSKAREFYRWRARVAVKFTGTGCVAGFRKHRSRDIVQVSQCFIVHERIMEVISILNERGTGISDMEVEVTMVVGQRGKAGLLVALDDIPMQKRQVVKTFFEEIYALNRQKIGNVFFQENGATRSYGQVQEHFSYEVDGLIFTFLPETFIQANVPTDKKLIDACLKFMFRDPSPGVILDLYAGIGNFSIPLAKKGNFVFAVEGNERSVLAGTTNAIRNNVKNVTFFHQSIEKYIREYVKRYKRGAYTSVYPKADAVVVDPPRTGLSSKVVKELLDVKLPRIVYVSCNAVTLATDLVELQKKYKIEDIVCIDMFPDTNHVETVVLLELS